MENELLLLNRKRKKGLLHIVFSRIGIIVVLILLELAMLISVYNWFADYFKWFALAQDGILRSYDILPFQQYDGCFGQTDMAVF